MLSYRLHPVPTRQSGVVILIRTDEHPDTGTPDTLRHHAGVLKRLPTQLKRQPLLRINSSSLPRRNPEKTRIKLINPVKEAPIPRTQGRTTRIERSDAPPISRSGRDRIQSIA
ncbi:hypothetical protein TPA0908_40850 [Micromonospora sp. AKA38]|nr:hypothetical protein TPA0908_40850 [Micromonospora sp. AKA38]